MECVLHEDNAGKMKANVIVEAAKLPTTPEADEIFRSRGITVLPDILTNAGGIVVSFFEWTHRICNKFIGMRGTVSFIFATPIAMW